MNGEAIRRKWQRIDMEAEIKDGDDDAISHLIGIRDGFSEAVQFIDLLTGGDGEYRFCTNGDPERHCPTPIEMIERIVARLGSACAPPISGATDRSARRLGAEFVPFDTMDGPIPTRTGEG